MGNAERGTVASTLKVMEEFGTAAGTAITLGDSDEELAIAQCDSDGEMWEVMGDEVGDGVGDIGLRDDVDSSGSEHPQDAPDQELQDGGSIFQWDDT